MIKTKEGTFYIVVNPFTSSYTITMYDSATECTYLRELCYKEIDEWREIEIAGKLYDVHVLYDQDFWIYVTEVNEEEETPMGCGKSREVQIEVQLHDGGPTTKLKRKQY
jgi:hypothetical protein